MFNSKETTFGKVFGISKAKRIDIYFKVVSPINTQGKHPFFKSISHLFIITTYIKQKSRHGSQNFDI